MFRSRAVFAALLSLVFASVPFADDEVPAQANMMYGDGSNPVCLFAEGPEINTIWHGLVDLSEFPGNSTRTAMVLLSSSTWGDSPLDTPFGQLLVDPRQEIYLLSKDLIAPGKALFSIPVPPKPALIGQSFYVQAMVEGMGTMRFCNAIELIIGGELDDDDDD